MKKLGRLEVDVVAGPPAKLTMVGRIDDTSAIATLFDEIPAGSVEIDTGGITYINSIGMREWIRLIRALQQRGDRVTLTRVAVMLLTQMNLIGEFKRAVTIRSFYAPYACAGCGAERALLVDAFAHAAALAQLVAPGLPCPECGAQMELGDFPERYLSIFQPPGSPGA